MQIEMLKVKDLIPYDNNTKKHDKKQIENVAKSIKEYGFIQPIVIDKNNVVVIGHCRLQAAKKLKMDDVPCVCVDDLTEEQVNALRIVDNKTNESEWDIDYLISEIAGVDLSMFDFDFGLDKKSKKEEIEGEIEFSEELLLSHNYIVLYFDNDFDWEVAQDKFGLKKVKDLIPRKGQPTGIGRVINGKDVLKWQN